MTTDIKTWVDEHRAIHAAATEHPVVVPQSPTWMEAMKSRGEYERDAQVNFPTALSMIEAVLELCDEWDRSASTLIPGMPDIENDEAFRIRLVMQRALEGVIDGG